MTTQPQTSADSTSGPGGLTLSDDGFRRIARIADEAAGLSIPDSKKALVQSRLSKRMRAIGMTDFSRYLELVSSPDNREERRELVSALTTNVSSFFREKHHFEHLAKRLIPLFREKLARREPVRIWSAGCSSGQEPYCIAMECLRAMPDAAGKDLLILATDIDPAILRRATDGVYTQSEIAGIEPEDQKRFLSRTPGGDGFAVNDTLRRLVRFRELNLHAPWPMRGQFDAIFCRNVVIYFDEAHQRKLWPRFHAALAPSGTFYLGHSERIHPLEGSGFANAGVTIYRKI